MKKCRWLAVLLALVIMMNQAVPMTTVAAFEKMVNKEVEEIVPPEENERPEITTPGWYCVENDWYYNDSNGNKVFGWKKIDGLWYYFDQSNIEKPGVMLNDCKQVIEGVTYFFAESGKMQTSWVKREEGWYYTNKSGEMLTGWQLINKCWYYLDGDNEENPGLMLQNCKESIGKKVYFFNESGKMQTSWVKREEGWYYADESGAMLTGWQSVGRHWYYFDSYDETYSGLMVSDCDKVIGNHVYHFNEKGEMLTGWYREGAAWYYLDASGLPGSGWRYLDGKWYYMNPADNNKMKANGWEKISNKWYYFSDTGAMKTGWLKSGENWYYLGTDGAMKTGWQRVDYAWYYMYTANDSHGGPEGAMAKNTTIDGYVLLANGVMKDSYIDVNLTTQYMRYVRNGSVLLECDVVTGLPRNGRATPAGEYKILEKKRNKILTGNIDPSTGKPEYRTPVDYWMRITWSGIGFHDATWQPKFGGDWYKTHGSHGCINMPYWAAKKLYDLVSVGTKTIIHY